MNLETGKCSLRVTAWLQRLALRYVGSAQVTGVPVQLYSVLGRKWLFFRLKYAAGRQSRQDIFSHSSVQLWQIQGELSCNPLALFFFLLK